METFARILLVFFYVGLMKKVFGTFTFLNFIVSYVKTEKKHNVT